MIGIYFSGTGNTRYCIEKFLKECGYENSAYSIEDPEALERLEEAEEIVLGYPVYASNLPLIFREFLMEHRALFYGKKVYIIATMTLFSGDGAGVLARLMEKFQAKVQGGIHVIMPDCICDIKIFKKDEEGQAKILFKADRKLERAARRYMSHRPIRQGLSIPAEMLGFFAQRAHATEMVSQYSDKIKIDQTKCVDCKKCMRVCPMDNFEIKKEKIVDRGQCTLCYRCANLCPTQAITISGSKVHQQSKMIQRYDWEKK
ncbi:EFR1 family ferrodoxin [Peptoniphilus sp. KCTC 25270]|uniref:EFR1 family ferrodoxin n=1 Tax=Peptoniphilus sp. KCTC 25270 TaxID=2897414 RepID=UPI001E51EE13|nr:EFR1 family ferrodoxin [Peptoniphilus sp. KCTC 25270]MCD1147501.1 EFR1 family ferrodoxin [Peptoniphilus sp. KCTC 25270]